MKRFLVFITTSFYEGLNPQDAFIGDFDTVEELLALKPDEYGTEVAQRLYRSSDLNILDTVTGVWQHGEYPVSWGESAIARRTEALQKIFGNDPLIRRYVLLAMQQYYPSGGMDDFAASYDSVEEAVVAIRTELAIDPAVQRRTHEAGAIGTAYWYEILDRVTFRRLMVYHFDFEKLLQFETDAQFPALGATTI